MLNATIYKRDQAVGENNTGFNAVLRKLATHCNFGVHLEEALRDRLVCGLQQETIQRRPIILDGVDVQKGNLWASWALARNLQDLKMPFAMRAARLDISLQLVEQGSA